jgi:hypothetical protein
MFIHASLLHCHINNYNFLKTQFSSNIVSEIFILNPFSKFNIFNNQWHTFFRTGWSIPKK